MNKKAHLFEILLENLFTIQMDSELQIGFKNLDNCKSKVKNSVELSDCGKPSERPEDALRLSVVC